MKLSAIRARNKREHFDPEAGERRVVLRIVRPDPEEERRKQYLKVARKVSLPKREAPADNYVYVPGGKVETVNSKMRRILGG